MKLVSILAVRRGGLGDLLVALPSLRLLRSAFPEARITLVARITYGRLFPDSGIVDLLENADDFRWAALADSTVRAGAEVPSLPNADFVVGWFHSKAGATFRENAAAVWPTADVRPLFADSKGDRPLNHVFFDLTAGFIREQIRPVAAFEDCASLPFTPQKMNSDGGSSAGEPMPGRSIVVHPGGGGRKKLWPMDRFLEAMAFLSSRGFEGVVVTGEAEDHLEPFLAGPALPSGWRRLRHPPLGELTALLARSAFYLGNDSGVTHLAAALGVPGLAVFRSEFLPAWNPGGRITVVSAADVRDISFASMRDRLISTGLIAS